MRLNLERIMIKILSVKKKKAQYEPEAVHDISFDKTFKHSILTRHLNFFQSISLPNLYRRKKNIKKTFDHKVS